MIRLKHLLNEISDLDIDRCLTKIKNKQFKLIGAGDNGRVYEIDGEDKVFKITKEMDEYDVADIIVNKYSKFTTFIPVYYVNGRDMYIMANAEELNGKYRIMIDRFVVDYKNYAREQGGEVSIFAYLDAEGGRNHDVELVNFLRALQQDVLKIAIPDFDLDLDFKTDNIMIYNGKMVMVDW